MSRVSGTFKRSSNLRRLQEQPELTRRELLKRAFASFVVFSAGSALAGCDGSSGGSGSSESQNTQTSTGAAVDLLAPADENGLRLPPGFSSRIVARAGEPPLPESGHAWHHAPDGGATFPTLDGGWIYVSNSERKQRQGGAGALRFDATGNIIDAYAILTGTNNNCSGGPTPWGTWLSCEEVPDGLVWECDPFGRNMAIVRPALGAFTHEAAAVDSATGIIYLTEDVPDGRFYRFIPASLDLQGKSDLASGKLQVAKVTQGKEGNVVWHDVPDPSAVSRPTRSQVSQSTAFRGGEGIWIDGSLVYFSTKWDNRIWAYDTHLQVVFIIYDDDFFTDPVLKGVDNVTLSLTGDVVVTEDGDDMQIVAITPRNEIVLLAQIVGHASSEVTGPAFNPAGNKLYFSSQRGLEGTFAGITFEITGPFVRFLKDLS